MNSIDRRGFLKTTAAWGLAPIPTLRSGPAGLSDDDALGVRKEFAVTQDQTYLNSAYVGPMPNVVYEAAVRYADEQRLTPAFVLYRQLEKMKGIELRVVPHKDGRAPIEAFEARTDARTRLISVAWVSNRNGYRHDLRALSELAHRHGGFLFADGIQALGTFPTNLHQEGVDFVCGNSYKWLFSSWGAAPFYVREEHLERIQPDRFGHHQVAESLPDFHFRLESTAKKYEYAGLIYGAVAQLEAALGFMAGVGLARIEEHGVALARKLRDGVAKLGYEMFTPPDNPSPIVSFTHRRDPKQVKRILREENISVTLRENDTQIRASVALFNNRSDIAHLLDALAKMARS